MSRIGKKLISVPKDVKVNVHDRVVGVEGPKGKLDFELPGRVSLELKEGQVCVQCTGASKMDKSLHGLTRSLIVNMIKGVTEGYTKELEIIGVGFRAQVQGNTLNMQLGFSHPVNYPVPEGIKIETPKQTQIVIRGIDKEKVGRVATQIRLIYPPEPYKGKGIRFAGEYIKKKVGKAQAAGKG